MKNIFSAVTVLLICSNSSAYAVERMPQRLHELVAPSAWAECVNQRGEIVDMWDVLNNRTCLKISSAVEKNFLTSSDDEWKFIVHKQDDVTYELSTYELGAPEEGWSPSFGGPYTLREGETATPIKCDPSLFDSDGAFLVLDIDTQELRIIPKELLHKKVRFTLEPAPGNITEPTKYIKLIFDTDSIYGNITAEPWHGITFPDEIIAEITVCGNEIWFMLEDHPEVLMNRSLDLIISKDAYMNKVCEIIDYDDPYGIVTEDGSVRAHWNLNINSSVESIAREEDNNEQYYNLQGMQTSFPSGPGIWIRKKGGNTEKIIVH